MDATVTISGAEEMDLEERTASPPSLFTRLKITGTLAAIGGFCGAGAGIALTYLGNLISGYPIPPSVGVYGWNAGIMAAIGATLGPPVAWSMLRTVPLWRALLEPAVAGVTIGVFSMLVAPSLFGVAVPLGIFGAALRLRWEYREIERNTLGSGTGGAEFAEPSAHTDETELEAGS